MYAGSHSITEVDIIKVERLNCSVNGNPRFKLHTLHSDFVTSSDASVSYDVENLSKAMTSPGVVTRLGLTKAGRIVDIEVAG